MHSAMPEMIAMMKHFTILECLNGIKRLLTCRTLPFGMQRKQGITGSREWSSGNEIKTETITYIFILKAMDWLMEKRLFLRVSSNAYPLRFQPYVKQPCSQPYCTVFFSHTVRRLDQTTLSTVFRERRSRNILNK